MLGADRGGDVPVGILAFRADPKPAVQRRVGEVADRGRKDFHRHDGKIVQPHLGQVEHEPLRLGVR